MQQSPVALALVAGINGELAEEINRLRGGRHSYVGQFAADHFPYVGRVVFRAAEGVADHGVILPCSGQAEIPAWGVQLYQAVPEGFRAEPGIVLLVRVAGEVHRQQLVAEAQSTRSIVVLSTDVRLRR